MIDLPALKALKALCATATPGPWVRVGAKIPYVVRRGGDAYGSVQIAECGDWKDKEIARYNLKRWLADAAFIAAARTALPELIERVEKVEAEARRWEGLANKAWDQSDATFTAQIADTTNSVKKIIDLTAERDALRAKLVLLRKATT